MRKMLLLLCAFVSISSANAQNVNIPDVNFKAYLVGNASINTNSDTEISVTEAAAYTGSFFCQSMSIADMTGVEAFPNVNTIYCWDNQLTALDLSLNVGLLELRCNDNSIATLDLSNNTQLGYLLNVTGNGMSSITLPANNLIQQFWGSSNAFTSIDLSGQNDLNMIRLINCNQLTSLDVTANSALVQLFMNNTSSISALNITGLMNLEHLSCNGTQLASLDISGNTALNYLHTANNNSLTDLDMSNGNYLNFAMGNFDATNCPLLTCVNVDNVSFANQVWTSNVDPGVIFSLDCSQGGTPLATSVSVVAVGGVAEVEVGSTLQMAADVLPSNASQTVIWQTQDVTGQASIDQNSGLLTGVSVGTVDVGALAIDGSNVMGITTVNVIEAAGIHELNPNAIRIYPNPAISSITINSDFEIETIQIFNLSGTLVQSELESEFSVENLDAGVYIINVLTDKGTAQKRLIKQ